MQRCRVADLQLATDTDGELKGQAVPRRSLVGPSAGRGRLGAAPPSIPTPLVWSPLVARRPSLPRMDTVVKQRSPNARKWHSTW